MLFNSTSIPKLGTLPKIIKVELTQIFAKFQEIFSEQKISK